MAKSVNQVILLGTVEKDTEVKYTASGVRGKRRACIPET
jgi:single-stranded DNA-binding protein